MAFQTDIDLSRLLRDNKYLKQIDELELIDLIEKYPQSYIFKAVLLKKYKLENNPKFESFLEEVSFYSPNRRGLYFFLKDDLLESDKESEEVDVPAIDIEMKPSEEPIDVPLEESEVFSMMAELNAADSSDDRGDVKSSEEDIEKIQEEDQDNSEEKRSKKDEAKEKKKRKKEKKDKKKKLKKEKKGKDKEKNKKKKKSSQDKKKKIKDRYREEENKEEQPKEHEKEFEVVLPDLSSVLSGHEVKEQISLTDGLPEEFLKKEERKSTLSKKIKPPVLSSDEKGLKKKEENFEEQKQKEEISSGHHSFLDWLDIVERKKKKSSSAKPLIEEHDEDESLLELERQYIADQDFLHPEELKKVEKNPPVFNKPKKKAPKKDEQLPTSVSDLAAQSVAFNSALMTETLAKVMEIQGKTERAIEIYSALRLNYPEKSSFFAAQIERLKNKI